MELRMLVAMVKAERTDKVVDAAKGVGATGATIIAARGAGMKEAKSFFGLTLEAHTDVVLFVLEESQVKPVMNAVAKAGEFSKPGTGIAFVLPVLDALGLTSRTISE